MAPIPEVRSSAFISSLFRRQLPSPSTKTTSNYATQKLHTLIARTTPLHPLHPGDGVTPPQVIPNRLVFIVFGLIGMGFVCTAVWFFFVAEHGGFQFRETDWEDYKSSVLRRKGPNGTTLSGGTSSTGSAVPSEKLRGVWAIKKSKLKNYSDYDEKSFAGLTIVTKSTKKTSGLNSKQRHQRRKKKKAKKSIISEAATLDGEMSQVGDVDDLIAYRHEKPARVGGLNKESDASAFDGSTNGTSVASSDVQTNRTKTPSTTKARKERKDRRDLHVGGIRKVYSTSEGAKCLRDGEDELAPRSKKPYLSEIEEDPMEAEARRRPPKGRARQRRDFSFQPGDDQTAISSDNETQKRREERERRRASRSPSKKKVPGGYEETLAGSDVSRDTGTKSYHHPIPELAYVSPAPSEYVEERRRKRNGGKTRHG